MYCINPRYDLEGLNIVSCTDKKCMWNEPQKSSLEKYQPQLLQQYDCILIKRMKNLEKQNNEKKDNCESKLLQAEEYFYSLEEHESLIRNIMVQNHPSSALVKHVILINTLYTNYFLLALVNSSMNLYTYIYYYIKDIGIFYILHIKYLYVYSTFFTIFLLTSANASINLCT